VCDPVHVPDIASFAAAGLPLLNGAISEPPETRPLDRQEEGLSNPFNEISLELRTQILIELPRDSFIHALSSTRSLHEVTELNWFWKARIRIDMPWLWEVYMQE